MNSVVIIGNGRSAVTLANGDYINTFNHVVRINRFRIKGFEKYIGTRTTHIGFAEDVYKDYLKTEEELFKLNKEFWKPSYKSIFSKGKTFGLTNKEIKEEIQIFKYNNIYTPEKFPEAKNLLFFNYKPTKENEVIVDNSKMYSTGFCSIMYFIEKGYTPTITGFDFFQKSSCYWYKNSKGFSEEKLIKDRTCNFTDGHPYLFEAETITKLSKLNRLKIL